MRWYRYLLVSKGSRSIDFNAPTYTELYEKLTAARKRGASYGYRYDNYEVVDLHEEDGRITYALQDPPRMPKWEPGLWFPDDDDTALRFKAMELE